MDDITKQLSGLALQHNNTSLPKHIAMILNDLEYLAKCYVMNITEIDFSQNSYIMCDDTYEHYEFRFPTYEEMYNILECLIHDHDSNVFVDKNKIFTYLDYYYDYFYCNQQLIK